jgi:hypothetical protein
VIVITIVEKPGLRLGVSVYKQDRGSHNKLWKVVQRETVCLNEMEKP